MDIYVDIKALNDLGDGTQGNPFRTISEAAKIAQPGDTVHVAPGLYREYVSPVNGGTEDARITYVSDEPLGATISGAEQIKNWEQYDGDVWVAKVDNNLFAEAKFNFTKKFNMYAGFSYTLYKNLPFYMLDTFYDLNNVYKTIYTDANVLNIKAGADYHLDERFSFGLKGNMYKYKMKGDLEKPLYKPGWDAFVTVAYNYNNKFYARLETGLLGKMYGLAHVGNTFEEDTIGMKYGIHLDMEYRITKFLSVFADLDNIAYQR